MKNIHVAIYGLIGAGLILLGSIGFLLPFGVLPEVAETFDAEGLHVVQEAGSAAIALGLLAVWCAFNYSKAGAAHWILTVYFLLIAALHWIDCLHNQRPLISAVLNTVPAATLIVMGFLRRSDSTLDS